MSSETQRPACTGADPEMFFDRARIGQAKRLCHMCPVIDTCLATELRIELDIHLAERRADGVPTGRIRADGVYGGLTGSQRIPLIRAMAADQLHAEVLAAAA